MFIYVFLVVTEATSKTELHNTPVILCKQEYKKVQFMNKSSFILRHKPVF
jgi:hypothetical protein